MRRRLRNMAVSEDPRVRHAAAEIAGWQGPRYLRAQLKRLAVDDADSRVRQAAWKAIRRQRDEADARHMLTGVPDPANPMAVFATMEAVAGLVDPSLLYVRDDPLEIGRWLDVGPSLRHRIFALVEDETKSFEKKMKDRKLEW